MQMVINNIVAPSWLDTFGRETFEFIKKELLEVELITNPDTYAMAMYSSWHSQYVALTKQLKKMQRDHKKQYRKLKLDSELKDEPLEMPPEMYGNPLSKQMDTCSKNMRAFGSDLGLSPSARAKLAIKLAQDDESEWE